METLKIQSGSYSAEIDLMHGGNCLRLRHTKSGADLLRRTDNTENPDNIYLYGMPVLFPVNRIKKGQFTFENRKYSFPINEPETNCHIHGLILRQPFKIKEQAENSVTCYFQSKEGELYKGFPHAFRIELTYTLTQNGLEHKTRIHNLSNENMPVFLGFHTTFNAPFVQGSSVEDIFVRANVATEYERDEHFLPTGVTPAPDSVTEALTEGVFTPKHHASRHYKAKEKGLLAIYDKKADLSVVYTNDEKYGYRLIYTEGNGFICLEPQTCLVNCQNDADRLSKGFSFIAPHSVETYISNIKLIKGEIKK